MPQPTPIAFPRAWRIWGFVAAMLSMAACSPPEPVRIGFLGGLSGRVADLGIGGRNGAILAVELRNQQGGVNGRRVDLIAEDDQQEPEVAREAVARLLVRAVEVIIGPMTSAMALAVLPQVNLAGIPLIAPTVTTNALTGLDDQFFRVVAPTATHASKSAGYQFLNNRLRRVVLLCDRRNQAYSKSWAGQTLKQAILARGEFAGAQSPIRFDANGDAQRDTFLSVIEHGEFVAIR